MEPTSQRYNYHNLERFLTVIRVRIWVKRLRLITVRIVLAGLVLFVGIALVRRSDFAFSSSGSNDLSGGWFTWLFLAFFGYVFGTLLLLQSYWRDFGRDNRLGQVPLADLDSAVTKMDFAKKLSNGMLPLILPDGSLFGVQIYKQGGILQWREFKIDLWRQIPLPPGAHMPHVLLDARIRDKNKLSNAHTLGQQFQELTPEGQAGKDYRIFVEKGGQVDALTIYSPDVLQDLMQYLPGVDIEINDSAVWFVLRSPRVRIDSVDRFLTGVEQLSPMIMRHMVPDHTPPVPPRQISQ